MKSSKGELAVPAEVLEAANAEILVGYCSLETCQICPLGPADPSRCIFFAPITFVTFLQALRKRSGDTNTDVSSFPTKYALA